MKYDVTCFTTDGRQAEPVIIPLAATTLEQAKADVDALISLVPDGRKYTAWEERFGSWSRTGPHCGYQIDRPTPDPIDWTNTSMSATWFRGLLEPLPWSFRETVGRIITISQQGTPPSAPGKPWKIFGDDDKTSFEFVGTFEGHPFDLYDYQGDNQIHIGGTDKLNLDGLRAALLDALTKATPTPFEATHVTMTRNTYGWKGPRPS